MLWAAKVFFPVGALLVLQSALAFVDGIRFLRLVRGRFETPLPNFAPTVTVVIPCKGLDQGFDENVDRFLNQAYPHYELVFAVATAADAAYQRLHERLVARLRSGATLKPRASLVVAGVSDQRGEKVHNLLHGIEAVDLSSQVLVFADIDATPSPDWLSSLVAPLADPQITVSTGFRWYLPGKGFVSRLRAAWDTSIATMMGSHDRNFAWGGSMAIRVAAFRELRIAQRYWANTVSDDYALTRAVRDAGGKIAFEPRCLLASREESSLPEFLRWSTRQIIITRVYAARLWKLGLAAQVLYCGTLILGLFAFAMPVAPSFQRIEVAATLTVILLLGVGKGYIRSIVTRELFGSQTDNGSSCYWKLAPVVPWIMLWNFVVAGFTRRIEWRGTEYELISQDEVRVLRRSSG